MPTRIYSQKEIGALASSGYTAENFGPDSPNLYLAFELASPEGIGDWLSHLPCPVIGIGRGTEASYCDVILDTPGDLAKIASNIERTPIAAMVLVQHLRAREILSVKDALTAESFAYGTLQTGPEFNRWKEAYDGPYALPEVETPLLVEISGGTLSLQMNAPETHNAVGIQMRDALCEALDIARLDPSIHTVSLTGTDRVFSTGGAVEEFGVVSDPATAHWVRSLRLPAQRLAQLKNRLNIHVNGAAIGAGAEIAAFGTHVAASKKAWFQLPELKYGLIPGAGGTSSLPRRIGRQRTAYMALSMDKINAQTALEWGLIDAVID